MEGCGCCFFELEENAPKLPLEHVWVLETNVDHISGEDVGYAFESLFDAGALDVMYIPGVGKKNRPAGLLRVICNDVRLNHVQDALFRSTMTLGMRRQRMERVALSRRPVELDTSLGPVQAKEATYGEERWTAPEFEALKLLAKRTGKSVTALRRELSFTKKGLRALYIPAVLRGKPLCNPGDFTRRVSRLPPPAYERFQRDGVL